MREVKGAVHRLGLAKVKAVTLAIAMHQMLNAKHMVHFADALGRRGIPHRILGLGGLDGQGQRDLLLALFGVLGLTCAALMILAMACGSEPFGYDYLYPLMPPGKASVRDGFVRSIWSELAKAGEVIGRHEM